MYLSLHWWWPEDRNKKGGKGGYLDLDVRWSDTVAWDMKEKLRVTEKYVMVSNFMNQEWNKW